MNRLNNLFPTDETIDMVKEYIRTKVIPQEIKSSYHFQKRFKLNNDEASFGASLKGGLSLHSITFVPHNFTWVLEL